MSAVVASEDAIATTAGRHLTSDAVLVSVAPGLAALGFSVEVSKRSADKISRPVLFGEGGAPDVTMDIDGFHDELGIVLEIEAGRAWNSNAVHRDLIRAALIADTRHLMLMVPLIYRSAGSPVAPYAKSLDLLESIYASGRLQLPFEGVLLLGY